MEMLNANAMVTYNNNSGQIDVYDSGVGNSNFYDSWNPPNYYEYHHYCYPVWYPTFTMPEKSKIEQAFRIIQKLMEKKIIKDLKVKEFIELVNEIAEIV